MRFGHSERVSTVAHTCEGRVVSGGDDGKLCLWADGGSSVSCEELEPRHRAPVSVLRCDAAAPVAISGSYDHSLRVWDVSGAGGRSGAGGAGGAGELSSAPGSGGKGSRAMAARRQRAGASSSSSSSSSSGGGAAREVLRMETHRAPVMALTWGASGKLFSGDRDGRLHLHDLSTGQPLRSLRHGSTSGHVTCVAHAGNAASAAGAVAGDHLGGPQSNSSTESSSSARTRSR